MKPTLGILLLVVFLYSNVYAQDKLTDADRSVIAFDINIEQLVANAKARGTDPAPLLGMRVQFPGPWSSLKWKMIRRIDGALDLPSKLSQFMDIGPGKNYPLDGYIRLTLTDAEAGKRFASRLSSKWNESIVADGTTEYRAPQNTEFKNLLTRKVTETEFEMLTDKFLTTADRDFKTPRLKARWDSLPRKAVRIAADLKTNAAFIKEAVVASKKANLPAASEAQLLTKLESFGLAADFTDDNLVEFFAMANSEEDAQEFQVFLNGILSILKSEGQAFIARIEDQKLPIVNSSNQVLESLQATQQDLDVEAKVIAPKKALVDAYNFMTTQIPYLAQAVDRTNVSPLEAKLRELIPEASGMKERDLLSMALSGATVNPDLCEDKSLTLVMFTLSTKPDHKNADEFCFLNVDPSALMNEAMRNSPLPTYICEDRITKMDFYQEDDVLSGTIEFSAPGLYRGKANFVANKQAEGWRITEFSLPKHGIFIIRTDPAKPWRFKKQPSAAKD